jgi:uncharacterized protein
LPSISCKSLVGGDVIDRNALHRLQHDPSTELGAKTKHLCDIIAGLGSVAVAYSGGTDSSLLLAVSLDLLGPEQVVALTADSPLTPQDELAAARTLAADLGARHLVLPSYDLDDPDIVANPPDRCYFCKFSRFEALQAIARREGFSHLLHGENADDAGDYRPGSRAAVELGVRAPLREAGLTKAHVRALSRRLGLPNWDRPANACLASRIPYGTPLTVQSLARVDAAEAALRQDLGLRALRVRDHHPVARLEVPPKEIERLAQAGTREQIVNTLRTLGYRYVTLDLTGYRMGSLNDAL